jgi:hypothetical protein
LCHTAAVAAVFPVSRWVWGVVILVLPIVVIVQFSSSHIGTIPPASTAKVAVTLAAITDNFFDRDVLVNYLSIMLG